VPKDLDAAVAWYRRAAEQGERIAQYNLAVMLVRGDGVEPDPEEALNWYRKAAEQGVPEAQIALGDVYATGRGVAVDHDEARRWFDKAAGQGHEGAAARLAALARLQAQQVQGQQPANAPAPQTGPQRAGSGS
jgi:TPR repeat protein